MTACTAHALWSLLHAWVTLHAHMPGVTSRGAQVKNPANGKVIAKMPLMRADETRAAVAAADAMFPEWKRQTAKQRGAILRRWGVGEGCLVDG
jgi:acyl-CoA reductase-like NAD-dependent aldehyde dehydrogenase